MHLYDTMISDIDTLLSHYSGLNLQIENKKLEWQDAGENNLVLKTDMKYELGGQDHSAASCLAFTTSDQIVKKDEIWVYGRDLDEINEDISYARIAFIRLKEGITGDTDEDYRIMRNTEYARYRVNPKGYMSRISVTRNREPVRVSNEAVENGISFNKVGKLYLDAYHKTKEVEAVKLVFITLPKFPYEQIEKYSKDMDKILESIDHIFKNFSMDCTTCGFKNVCDEVEGMKELHLNHIKKSK